MANIYFSTVYYIYDMYIYNRGVFMNNNFNETMKFKPPKEKENQAKNYFYRV